MRLVVGIFAFFIVGVLLNNFPLSSFASSVSSSPFVEVSGVHFVRGGQPFYINGFNAYWLMVVASQPGGREKVSAVLSQAADLGPSTVVRTWAFSDAGDLSLQRSPGFYDETMYQARGKLNKCLDYVISEAKKHGVYLILSFVNNFDDFGGKKQYVKWGNERGQRLRSINDFYSNKLVKQFYKNHVKSVLTRKNTITGIQYKDDPTIMAWELMNEPRFIRSSNSDIFQAWIQEMASYVKSIDGNHLLEVGLEGFYGDCSPEKKLLNPGFGVGTDFICNNLVKEIDFATIHIYPDQWLPFSGARKQNAFLRRWIQAHVQDSEKVIGKPLLVAEFGLRRSRFRFGPEKRDRLYRLVYSWVYDSARSGGAGAGGLFWQLLVPGLDGLRDGYEVIFEESPSTASIVYRQSEMLSGLNKHWDSA
ncbi:hypothetical protein HPP92_009825 [Vanilla planifolia]|uniref:mannan endo-1,4-beta-mannosidase n=1 Tax=Vanilla planifolia TaxID=51239 RepID=A0A835R8U4_VANPL|nr:hypothetical protein HPP92_009825 [Vanilla planifolia]